MNKYFCFLAALFIYCAQVSADDFATRAKANFPVMTNADQYAEIREELRKYGVVKFETEMTQAGVFSNGKIVPSLKPFNAFARILSGDLIPPYPLNLLEQRNLGHYAGEFFIAKNKPELDANWQNEVVEGAPLASMSLHHEFLVLRDPTWENFNVLTLGINGSVSELERATALLEKMRVVAMASATAAGWGNNVGLYFHCFPSNSVQTLHLHIVDLKHLGPSYYAQTHKNLSLDAILKQLRQELEGAKFVQEILQ